MPITTATTPNRRMHWGVYGGLLVFAAALGRVGALVGGERCEPTHGSNEIGLAGHHSLEILVGARHLVEDVVGARREHLAPGVAHQRELIVERELATSRSPAQCAPGTVA